jgi:hypothetical protein
MTEDTSPSTPAQATDKPAPRKGAVAAVEQAAIDVEQHIETWFQDLLASLPHLRETATYNHLRGAIDDLKNRLA